MHKNTVSVWEEQFGAHKETLMLYSLCQQFISLVFEGDELHTVVGKRSDADRSQGWTAVIMDRASRFIVDQQCEVKDIELFKSVMGTVCQYIAQTQQLSFFSDGQRLYGNTLFDLCAQTLHTGKRGRPCKTLPEGVKVRVKNKGDQKHKRGTKRPKYHSSCQRTSTNQSAAEPLRHPCQPC